MRVSVQDMSAERGTPKAQIARDLGISKITVYRALADAETEIDINSVSPLKPKRK